MSRDDHDDDRPEAPATAAEQARAEQFGRLLDDLLDGEPLPPAMDSDQRALVETASQVVASTRVVELDDDRRQRIVDRALEAALTGRRATTADPDAGVSGMWSRRRPADRAMRILPWAVASIAAAAAIVLFVTRPAQLTDLEALALRAERPVEQRSRPADPLVGRIPRDEVGAASVRLDAIWADRMAGYRAVRLGGAR
jgi:hypothetical protein